jgi:hypothetical protein
MVSPNVASSIDTIRAASGIPIRLDGDTLTLGGEAVGLPTKLTGEKGTLFGIDGLFPTVPRADDRDKLLWSVVAEAKAKPDQKVSLLSDQDLAMALPRLLNLGEEASQATADALMDRFFNRKNADARVLLPVHSSLPLNYKHVRSTGRSSGFRMFNGGILPFLLWQSSENNVDTELLATLFEAVSDDTELTALDRHFLDVALKDATDREAKADATELVRRYAQQFHDELDRPGAVFCQPSMDLFRRDLATVLSTDLPRPDKILWLTLLLSLHLTVRLYRIAVIKGNELDIAVAAAGQLPAPPGVAGCACAPTVESQDCLLSCPMAGMLRFRTSSGRYRPVRDNDGCRTSYVKVDERRLLDMPATLVTRTLGSHAWAALGGGEAARRGDLLEMARALNADRDLRRHHDALCRAIAVLHHDQWRGGASTTGELEDVTRIGPGLHALREDVRKMRSRDLRHQSRDIVNQLVLDQNVGGQGSLVSRNGTRSFYELDEQLLLLLVRLTCQDAQIPYDEFLSRLSAYGLAPQDNRETDSLADALERLGLLVRFSDSGEASFVHYN